MNRLLVAILLCVSLGCSEYRPPELTPLISYASAHNLHWHAFCESHCFADLWPKRPWYYGEDYFGGHQYSAAHWEGSGDSLQEAVNDVINKAGTIPPIHEEEGHWKD